MPNKTVPDREILVPLRNFEQILDFTTKAFFFFGELTQVLNPAEYGQVCPRPSKALREEKFRIFWDPLQTPKLVYFWNTITFSATGLGISIGWKT